MKFKKYGELIPDLLDKEVEFQPIDFAQKSPFKRLNYLLGLIEEKESNKFIDYVKNLEMKLKSLIKEDIISKKKIDINKLLTNFDFLKRHPELAKKSLNYLLLFLSYFFN